MSGVCSDIFVLSRVFICGIFMGSRAKLIVSLASKTQNQSFTLFLQPAYIRPFVLGTLYLKY